MSYNKSIFFVPVWFGDFSRFTKRLSRETAWNIVEPQQYSPRYLLKYAVHIAENKDLFQLFQLEQVEDLKVYMFRDELQLKNVPQLEQVRMACFATGVGFLEFWVNYQDMTPEDIANFAYLFKKATKMCNKSIVGDELPLYDVASRLMPKDVDAKLFFTATAPFKYECSCFHFLHVDEAPGDEKQARERIYRLSRSYNTSFSCSVESDYDMLYKSAEGDHWGGSSEGLVNISYDLKNDDEDYYLHNIKLTHLSIDYYFLYLMLLNQRFTAIQYISDIATAYDKSRAEITQLNRRIVNLKTVFSFNVLSDDKIFQNVYAKMYAILEIEHLLSDIVDNEGQMQVLQAADSAKTEQMSNKFLASISILSLFSALIDASSYFDRIAIPQPIATQLSLLCVGATIVLCVIWLIRSQK